MRTAMLMLICIHCVFCYPSKPLNERSTELAWEAWLLVDQGNKDMGVLRRRITPKSVFIAPTFSPESLPACADGYISDSMGRCMQIVKINESNHLNFLLEKLKQRFPSRDFREKTGEASTQGPLQFNIPLVDNDDFEENETNIAIVVSPSSKSHEKTAASVKVDVKRNGDRFNIEDVAAILRVKPEDVEMTELTTTLTTTTGNDETTTFETTTDFTTTEMETTESTTMMEGDAIFFRWRI